MGETRSLPKSCLGAFRQKNTSHGGRIIVSTHRRGRCGRSRTHGCLVVLDLKTEEDLVRFIKENGFQKLLKTKYFGKLSLEKFKASLIQERIIDESENSYLFEYIS